ncbi:MAG: ribulose bisphosphate carboxylase small subunit [Nevskiales bacterium]|nr:ribulose bisphosphate carboxylase small subunit [Nevskiales bacterium]
MRLTQGAFSFLPDLSDDEIRAQVDYGLERGWAWAIETTDDPHPRNTYWEMWGTPMFGLKDGAAVLYELEACRKGHADQYIRLCAFDSTRGVESIRLAFIVNRPAEEPGFALQRQDGSGRSIRYGLKPYSADRPQGMRYRE